MTVTVQRLFEEKQEQCQAVLHGLRYGNETTACLQASCQGNYSSSKIPSCARRKATEATSGLDPGDSPLLPLLPLHHALCKTSMPHCSSPCCLLLQPPHHTPGRTADHPLLNLHSPGQPAIKTAGHLILSLPLRLLMITLSPLWFNHHVLLTFVCVVSR